MSNSARSTVRDEYDVLWRLRRNPRILELLHEAGETELQQQQRLRREFDAALVRAALTLNELRQKASGKFSRASQMWFSRQGLEQATPETVARHKAQRFEGRVWDYCCGIGGDALALAERGEVLAVDRQPAACLMTTWNADVYGVESHVQAVCTEVESLADRSGLLHVDPDRRSSLTAQSTARGRAVRIEDCSPDLNTLRRLIREFAGGAIKLSPASNFAGKFPEAEIELVSLAGECKEATVWFGRLAAVGVWRATVLPSGDSLAGDPLEAAADIGPLSAFLYDPDPAVVRAGLVDLLAARTSLMRIDEKEEYLTSDEHVQTRFATAFEVVAELPNNDREIRRFFRESDFGQVEIKCRHVPVQADAVRRKLHLEGSKPCVLVFARITGKTRAVVCRRIASPRTG